MFEGFWDNVFRYCRYFVTVILGVLLSAIAPLIPLFNRPATAIPVVGLLLGFVMFTVFTLRAMLGLSPF
jgi:sensor histidine kinase regulating citrate/malate metabolism